MNKKEKSMIDDFKNLEVLTPFLSQLSEVVEQSSNPFESWEVRGWTLEDILECIQLYYGYSQEKMSYDEVDDAITHVNYRGGLCPERQEAFFAGYYACKSANN